MSTVDTNQVTITYDEINKGWTSFHSYEPEWMERLGNRFYTFKNGNVYIHEDNETRTNFYGTNYGCSVTVSVNKEPSTVKVFKTIGLESNNTNWYATLNSELESGKIGSSSNLKFEDKEGVKYGYIRRHSSSVLDFNELSIIGLGNLQSIPSTNNYRFTSDIPNQITANNVDGVGGDALYFNNGTSLIIGGIDSIDGNTITTTISTNTPSVNDFCFVAKNPSSESFGLRGYHSTIKLVNQFTGFVELYSVNSEVMKSYM